jgi:enoyl-[acyl-carrier protein] reductase I
MHEGKTYLITGILTKRSIASAVAKLVADEGASILVTSFGRSRSTTVRTLNALGLSAPVLEYDASSPTAAEDLAEEVSRHTSCLDGLLFAVAGASSDALQRDLLQASSAEISATLTTSATALASLALRLVPHFQGPSVGASVVALTFAPHRVWPAYGWMGIAKGTLESVVKHLAVELGPFNIRVNQVDAGPLRTAAARQIGAFSHAAAHFEAVAPLGWDANDAHAVAAACAMLLSPVLRATTGTTIVVDGGTHLLGGAPHD